MLISLMTFLGFAAGFYTRGIIPEKSDSISFMRFSSDKLTSPLLDCEIFDSTVNTQVNTLKKNVNDLIESLPETVSEVSVYYRDLNNGPSFGINEQDKFAPASLLKVPLMIAYLKKVETNPDLLQEKIGYSGQHYLGDNLPQQDTLTKGENYTVDNLLYRMIALSDNIAFETLLNHISPDDIKKVHKDLDIIYPNNNTPDDYISVKSYAGLFRVLYNATYLNQQMSEKALQYLTQTDFHLGIQAGIPKNITSALKFGLRDINEQGTIQIHDCGIIYGSKKPYLLCVMTKGENRDELIRTIQQISSDIYQATN